MDREILFKAKHEHVVVTNKDLEGQWVEGLLWDEDYIYSKDLECELLIDKNTICTYTGLHDKNDKRIWENDILMCHGNPDDLVKAEFGEFSVIDPESEEIVDSVIGWHYEVIKSSEQEQRLPFYWSRPLTDAYVSECEMEVIGNIFDNPELLEERDRKDEKMEETERIRRNKFIYAYIQPPSEQTKEHSVFVQRRND